MTRPQEYRKSINKRVTRKGAAPSETRVSRVEDGANFAAGPAVQRSYVAGTERAGVRRERSAPLSPEQQKQEEVFRTARTTGAYDQIWQTVGRCVFCDHDKAEGHHEVYEENGVYMTVPAYAYVDGHLLVIPRRHVRSVKELTAEEWETMRKMFYLAKKMIRETYGIKGMQIVQKDGREAQSTVEHLHFHCIPFDAPDLSVWNHRELANTPYENAEKYRANAEKMTKLAKRYGAKYGQ